MMYQSIAKILLGVCIGMLVIAILNGVGKIDAKEHKIERLLTSLSELLNRFYYVALFGIFIVFLFSRLYLLGVLPLGMHVDELGMAYDAQCLARYGVDRHLVRYPFYLINYGGGQNALYTYLTMILLKFLPFSVTVIRLPAVFCACICFFSMFFLLKEMRGSNCFALLGPVFVTITPYFMFSERWALESSLFLSLLPPAILFLIRAVKYKKMRDYVFSAIVFGLVLYTYAISYLVLPLLLGITILYLIWVKRFELKNWIVFSVILGCLACPLIINQLINMKVIPEFSFLCFDFKKLFWYRSDELSLGNILMNWDYLKTLLLGGDGLSYNSFEEFGPVYLFMIPLVFFGLAVTIVKTVQSFKKREFSEDTLILFTFVSGYFVLTIAAELSIGKANELFFTFIVFCIVAIISMWEMAKKGNMGNGILVVMLLVMGISYLMYGNFYFREQNEVYGYHDLFVSTYTGELVKIARDTYIPDNDKPLYCEIRYDDCNQETLLLSLYGDESPWDWNEEQMTTGNVRRHLPEEIDPDEDAVYLIGDSWDHIVSYMASEWGFSVDNTYPSYKIVYKN